MFDPDLNIGQVLKNSEIVSRFKCGNMGGMRRSKTTNTLVLVTDYTKGLYHDKWIAGVLHYTGMGKSGDQDIHWAQNATLAACGSNGVDVHLFEVIDPGEYIYCGRVALVGKPYIDIQPGEDGQDRKVWIFPIRPVPDNDVRKPDMFIFKDMDDYQTRGKSVDAEYMQMISKRKSNKKTSVKVTANTPAIPRFTPKPEVAVPHDIIGQKLRHKHFGEGYVVEISGTSMLVSFSSVGEKKLGYGVCMKNHLIEFI